MKLNYSRIMIFVFMILVVGCVNTPPMVEKTSPTTQIETLPSSQFPTKTVKTDILVGSQPAQSRSTPILEYDTPPTRTLTPSPTATPTLIQTIEPTEAAQLIATLLQTNGNCLTPCFWGLYPGITLHDQAVEFLNSLGSKVSTSNENDSRFYTSLSVKEKIYVSIEFVEINGVLLNIYAGLNGFNYEEIKNADWAAFRPDNILRAYGVPDEIGFYLGFPTELTTEKIAFYDLVMIYDEFDFTIAYYHMQTEDKPVIHICPLVNTKIFAIDLWLGKGIDTTPKGYISLLEATNLSPNQFYTLLLGSPQLACLDIDINTFIK